MFRTIYPDRWFVWTVTVIFITFIIIEGAVVQYAIESRTEGELIATTPTPQLLKKTIDIDTSNWLTYRNEKYGFELKYAPTILFVNRKNKSAVDTGSVIFEGNDGTSFAIDVLKDENPNEKPIAELLKQEFKGEGDDSLRYYGKIGGVDAYASDGGLYWFTRGKELFIIGNGAVFLTPFNNEEFDKILATFKFFEPAQ